MLDQKSHLTGIHLDADGETLAMRRRRVVDVQVNTMVYHPKP